MTRLRPSLWLSTLCVAILVALWALVRMAIFGEHQVPLTYVLPLLVCVWTRRRWQLVAMVVAFLAMTGIKYQWILPAAAREAEGAHVILGMTLFNIIAGAVVIELILRLRDALDARAEAIQRQNSELEAQAEELAQQNEEIKAQSEELAQQNEEIESQGEELQRQNEELVDANERLQTREAVLQSVVECARHGRGGPDRLGPVCQRVLGAIGAPAELVALAESEHDGMAVRAQVSLSGDRFIPAHWSRAGSIAAVVLEHGRTAYVDDLHSRPDLASPFSERDGIRSVLAALVTIGGTRAGVLMVCSRQPGHWTQDQFRLLEWSAAQCGLILESVRAQSALRDRALAVESANRAKDEFLATLSHELRTPLSPVLVAVEELAEDGSLPAEARSQLEMVRRNVAVQSRLIDDLLDLTRIARGKMDLNHQPIRVHTLLRETAAVVAADLAAREQTLVTEIEVPEQCRIVGDAARLQQVFWNLLKNSTKFSPRGGTIRIRASMTHRDGQGHGGDGTAGAPDRLIVEVTDSGPGIAAEDIERIFQPFEQAAGARTRGGESGGLGLGLSIARAITELHDGSLRARSEGAGRGATFTVELPLAPDRPFAGRAIDGHEFPGIQTLNPGQTSGNILLVEDHGDTAAAIGRVLRRAGFSVVHAPAVAPAIDNWRNGRFDLLISDLGLPDGTGLDVIRAVRDVPGGEIPAICMSGYGMESDLNQSRAAGFQVHLIKPVSKQRLLEAVQQALERGKTSPQRGQSLDSASLG